MNEELQEMKQILNSINQSLQDIKENNSIEMLTAKDVSKILGINVNSSTDLLKRDDIPSIKIGTLKIEKSAFKKWLQKKEKKFKNFLT